MIRTESEYAIAVARLTAESKRLTAQRAQLQKSGLKRDEIKRVTDPMKSFSLQLKEEVQNYQRLKQHAFDPLENFRGFGHLLISLRIAKSISQRELAKRLDVHESQISRDERNEYFGISIERAMKVLDALGVRIHSSIEINAPKRRASA